MEEAKTTAVPDLLCCQNESSESDTLTKFQVDNCCLFVCLFQMVPLVKNSTDTLIEKLGEFAESGKSVDVYR